MTIIPTDIGLPTRFKRFRVNDISRNINQFDIAYEIATSDKRFSILGAPPGSGKTVINMAVGQLMEGKRVLYLVSTNQLLQQVYDEFSSMGIAPIKGMANYVCNDAVDNPVNNRTTMCNEGKCLSGYSCELRQNGCDYFNKVDTARNEDLVLSNFAYRASTARYSDPTNIGVFDLIICDEAHLLLDWMSDFCAIKLDRRDLKKLLGITLPNYNDISSWSKWASDNIDKVKDYIAESKRAGIMSAKKTRVLAHLGQDLRTLSRIASSNSPWIIDTWRFGTSITPVEPGEFLEKYIFLNAPKIILCSASITESDAPSFNCDDYTFFSGGSGHPVANRPMVFIPTCSVKYRMSDVQLRTWMLQIDYICDLGLDYRGIIHSVSYDRMRYIYNNSRHQANMIIHRGSTARGDTFLPSIADALDQFFDAPPPIIIVSPILGTGYDFKYDLARWQIISKIPFLNHTTPLVAARKLLWTKKYKLNYLTIMAAKAVLQIYGRICRADDDYGITYIIDNAWGKYVSESLSNPMSFRNAMSTCYGLPNKLELPK